MKEKSFQSEVSIKMSACVKEPVPSRCYCRVQDEEVSLNDIARIITALNIKTVQLRNEVNALKNDNANVEEKLCKKSENTRERSSSCRYGECPDIFRSNDKPDRCPEVPDTLTHLFRNNSIKKREVGQRNIDDEGHIRYMIKNNTDCNRVYNLPKIRRKKISRNVQCDLSMERKRSFFDRFGIKLFKECKLKGNKKVKHLSKAKHVTLNSPIGEVELSNGDLLKDTQLKNCCKIYSSDIGMETINQIFEQSQIQSKGRKNTQNQFIVQENKISKIELDEYGTLHKNAENKHQIFKCTVTGRMGGGAEFRGSRLISDMNERIQKINLYKHVKLDAKNVKRRLDACIAELNEIIEDVSLIFPDTNISKE